MHDNSVVISYFDPFDNFENVRSEFMQLVPFQNVHWKASNGNIRTVDSLPVDFVVEGSGDSKVDVHSSNLPFIRLLVVSCKSIDEYRAKVRPLVKHWLSSTVTEDGHQMASTPMIFLYANTEVVDSNLFKSVSLIDKFSKDFPTTKTLEIKSVYKSPKEREEFWLHFANQLRNSILNNFQERLNEYDRKLKDNKDFFEGLLLREKLMALYLSFKINEEATVQLNEIRKSVVKKDKVNLPKGELEIPSESEPFYTADSIVDMLKNRTITEFKLYRYFFVQKYKLILTNANKNQQCIDIFKLIREFIKYIDTSYNDYEDKLKFDYQFLSSAIKMLPKDETSDSSIFYEINAEILLLSRDIWLHGVALQSNMHITGKSSWGDEQIKYKFDITQDTFSNEETFQENFLIKTKEILTFYNKASITRQRIVDILSIEIGCLHYERGEFEKAVAIFLSCYEYYTQTNWNAIGLNILKIFVDSLSSCEHLSTLTIEAEDVPVTTALGNAYLNIIELVDDLEEKKDWWKKFLEIQEKYSTDLVHSTDNLFNLEIIPNVKLCDANVYGCDIILSNKGFPEDIKADSIILTLKNNQDMFILFTQNDITITKESKYINLNCSNIIYGSFEVVSLEILFKGTTFIKEFDNENGSININIVHMYYQSQVNVDICRSKELSLTSNTLQLILDNCDELDLLEIEISVEQLNERIPISFSKDKTLSKISFTKDSVVKSLDYYCKSQLKSFNLKVHSNFKKKISDTTYSETKFVKIDAYLPVSVSVEEIFKKEFLCFKFHLNSSLKANPVLLYSSSLTAPKDKSCFSIYGDFKPETPITLSDDITNSCMNCYTVKSSEKFNEDDIFSLCVKYMSCKKQLDTLVTEAILVEGNIEWFEDFEKWKIFWRDDLLPMLKYNYEEFENSNKIIIEEGCFDIKSIARSLKMLSMESTVSSKILKCLMDLSAGIIMNQIDIRAYTKNIEPDEFLVPVEFPRFEHFFHISFEPIESFKYLNVTNPVKFKLKVKNMSDLWNKEPTDECFKIAIVNNNKWLIHGKKSTNITRPELELDLVLIPLERGYLDLPKVGITNKHGEMIKLDNANSNAIFLVL
ncbi:hypothetical protein TPHA_0G00590 [Tetrapisispora phaffii CBS 4417]|uniref:Trafficking protein particle complex subunit 11 domain-containing protein n=1 Tax=Tetrapisispora phaffii (strain ATCC 24235 / CBS 4417 / NBRC 1672 / NRRL Y-8282 / UCD 70-5) TaxID=1071381 RepID=G8BVG7_TETPH|nr:hypothetical protein TPHA_0G00590 [Tetrapisispora phaffii CBS 4417]CCE63895.1 hypothetical protein TPHA_0G00590 [Tetrapisispora phaffii CBS 4417]